MRALKNYYDLAVPKTTFMYTGQGAIADLPKDQLIEMEEEGIINAGGIGFSLAPSGMKLPGKIQYVFQFGKRVIIIESANREASLKLTVVRFTRIGAEIVSLGNCDMDSGYLTKLIDGVKEQGFRVYEVSLNKETEEGLDYNTEEVIER